jgi:uncharacterized RDD family membrane protein YckC
MEKLSETLPETSGNLRYTSFAKRLKAFAFDYLIICGYIIILVAVTLVVVKTTGFMGLALHWPENPLVADLIAFVTLVLPIILYFTLQESSSKQATWGKEKTGIRVVNIYGGTLTRAQAFTRSLVKLIPWQIAHTCLYHIPGWPLTVTVVPLGVIAGFVLLYVLVGIYFASALISKKHRTPYDWVAGAYVIETDKDKP